jgi:membrane-bound serine protease (ClpP class)
MLESLAHLPPDVALVVLTVGLLLIYVELNRPRWIVPGAVGLIGALFAIASLARMELSPGAIALGSTAIALLVIDLLRRTQWIVALAATLALVLGFDHLVVGPGGMRSHTATAVVCGLVLGGCTSILTRIARRARANKGLD